MINPTFWDHLFIHAHILAGLIARQGPNPKLRTIFARPYITRLVRAIDALAGARSMERVGGTLPLSLSTLHAIWIVERRG